MEDFSNPTNEADKANRLSDDFIVEKYLKQIELKSFTFSDSHNNELLKKKAKGFLSKYSSFFDNENNCAEHSKFNKNNYRLNTLISKKKSLIKSKNDFFLPTKQNEDITLINQTLKTIQTLPESILNFKDLQNFQCCQILIHEKGSQYSESIFHDPTNKLNFTNLTSQQFTDVFNIIKKSKSKNFDQSNILSELIGSVGTFLAKEIQLQNHNVIVIVSRNDFLPSSKEEQTRFNTFIDFLGPLVDKLLKKRQNIEKSNNLFLTLDNLPIPLSITDSNKNIVFNNLAYKMDLNIENSGSKLVNFKIGKNYILNISINEKDNLTDIHHFQRISLLGELLNTLQHELSNPLFGIKLTAELLESDDSDTQDFLNEISNYSGRCQDIIKNFSQIYQNDQSKTLIDVYKFIREIITLTKSETRGIHKDVEVINFEKTEDIITSSNKSWLYHIIFNLIINASQAIKAKHDVLSDGKILITLTKVDSSIEIKVTDNGLGIKKEDVEKITSPFYTTKESGTGLGLAICQNLIKKMNSSLIIDSTWGSNASFSFQIPLKKR